MQSAYRLSAASKDRLRILVLPTLIRPVSSTGLGLLPRQDRLIAPWICGELWFFAFTAGREYRTACKVYRKPCRHDLLRNRASPLKGRCADLAHPLQQYEFL